MTVIAGTLRDGMGRALSNVPIELVAIATSSVVIAGASASVLTGTDGSYTFNVAVGQYTLNITFDSGGPQAIGIITVYSDSPNGSLEAFLTIPGESQVTPTILAQVIQARIDAINARNDTIAARDEAIEAKNQVLASANSSGVYDSISLGLAATTNGQTFSVKQPTGSYAASYTYRNDSGSATFLFSSPSADFLNLVNNLVTDINARTAGIFNPKNIFDYEGLKIGGAFMSRNGKIPIYYNEKGNVGLANTKIKISEDTESDFSLTSRKGDKTYIRGSKNGGVIIGRLEFSTIPGPKGLVLVDKNYRPYACDPIYAFNSGRTDIPIIGQSGLSPVTQLIRIKLYDSMGLRSEGQSLSLGLAADLTNNHALSVTQPYNNKGFSTNQNTANSSTDTAVPLIEKDYTAVEGTYPGGETPCTMAANTLVELIQAETGLTYDKQASFYFGSAPGKGGQAIVNLIKGTVPYQRMLDHVTNSVRLCAAMGKTHAEFVAFWKQGETDYNANTSRIDYYDMALQYIKDSAEDKKSITGQDFNPLFISYQLSTHKTYNRTVPVIALALRDLALAGFSWMSAPGYIMDYNTDNVHAINYSYQMWAKYDAIVAFKILMDDLNNRDRGQHRLDVINEVRQGSLINWTLNPIGELKFDTSWVTATTNMGIDIHNKTTGALVDIITGVSIVGSNKITIACSRPLTDNEIVTYAWGRTTDTGNGRVHGPRGNIRDSQGDLSGYNYVDGAGTTRSLHNWLNIIG